MWGGHHLGFMVDAQETGKSDIDDESKSETAHKASTGPLGGIDIRTLWERRRGWGNGLVIVVRAGRHWRS